MRQCDQLRKRLLALRSREMELTSSVSNMSEQRDNLKKERDELLALSRGNSPLRRERSVTTAVNKMDNYRHLNDFITSLSMSMINSTSSAIDSPVMSAKCGIRAHATSSFDGDMLRKMIDMGGIVSAVGYIESAAFSADAVRTLTSLLIDDILDDSVSLVIIKYLVSGLSLNAASITTTKITIECLHTCMTYHASECIRKAAVYGLIDIVDNFRMNEEIAFVDDIASMLKQGM